MPIRLATWNINSVRLRLNTVQRFVHEANPDIICLQETKAEDVHFPQDALVQMGYPHVISSGQKSYNGVAILSRLPLINPQVETFVCAEEKRHISAELPDGTRLHNFYIPAGGDIPDPNVNPKFEMKLAFVDEMTRYFSDKRHKGSKIIIVGDFNIAPLEHDVWSHKQLLSVVSHTPIEVEKLEKLQKSLNWVDTARHFVPDNEKLYSWWSYRNQDWEKSNRGRRLDHIWVTPNLKDALCKVEHVKHIRGWEQPSDHVPVITELNIAL